MTTPAPSQIVSAADVSPKEMTASEKRALEPLLRSTWSIQALWPRLPLLFPTDAAVPATPKTQYCSQYHYASAEPLQDAARLSAMRPFEISLRLIDFSPLESLLAQHYKQSHKGQVPYHPVSMFLALLLRRELGLTWRGVATLLADSHGAGWRALCGFEEKHTPSFAGLHYFFVQVGAGFFAQLCQRFIDLLLREGLCSQHSTYPGDPPSQGVTITQDGMLHPARHRPDCQLATDDCYQPIPEQAPAEGKRPCRARRQGHEGCACDTPDCQKCCRRASRLDPEARFMHYDGRNKHKPQADDDQVEKGPGTDVFGYRSIADRIIDDRLHVAWTARSALHPASTDERTVFPKAFTQLRQRFPDLRIGEWIDDAAIGYRECLQAIWEVDALRMVDTRADASDRDPERCLRRGYDAHGHPLCPHNYRLHSNGHDAKRRRRKWVCRQACQREPRREGEAVQPVADCPFLNLKSHRAIGYVTNVGCTFPDGSARLARDIPQGSPEWNARYGRRSNSESRNGQLEGMGLKRMCAYGLDRNAKEVQIADLIINLHTMGRLVQEAGRLRPIDPGG